MNVPAEITHDDIWTSVDTGNRYPARAPVTAPLIDLDLSLEALMERSDVVYKYGGGKSGGQAPCRVIGRIGTIRIDKLVIFEMLGSVGRCCWNPIVQPAGLVLADRAFARKRNGAI
jgi:hypothetical protein